MIGTRFELALFLHLLGVASFFSGAAVAAVALESARRRTALREIAVVLASARAGVALLGAGLALVLASGFWLVELGGWELGSGWLAGALALLAVSVLLGAAGGRAPRHARVLAARAAEDDGEALVRVRALLDDPVARALNYGSTVAALGVLALMVFKPG